MGWIAVTKTGEVLQENVHGRPVQDGEDGKLLIIAQEDYGHKIAVDLVRGLLLIDYDELKIDGLIVNVENPKAILAMCDDTNRLHDIHHMLSSDPDPDGWVQRTYVPLTWRPIWFTRWTNGDATKCIGAQTTMPTEFGGHNVKKMISLFSDGVVGITG